MNTRRHFGSRVAALSGTLALFSLAGLAQQGRTVVAPTVGRLDNSAPRSVVDGNGTAVGSLLNPITAVRRIGDDWVAFVVGPSGFIGSTLDVLLYSSSDCSGTAYILDPLGTGFRGFFGYGAVAGGTLYYGVPSEAVDVAAASAKNIDHDGLSACFAWEDVLSRSPRAPAHTLSLHLTAPFRLAQ